MSKRALNVVTESRKKQRVILNRSRAVEKKTPTQKQLAQPLALRTTDNKVFYVHRLILKHWSKVFEAMLDLDPLCEEITIDHPSSSVYPWIKTFHPIDNTKTLSCADPEIMHLVMPMYHQYEMRMLELECIKQIIYNGTITPKTVNVVYETAYLKYLRQSASHAAAKKWSPVLYKQVCDEAIVDIVDEVKTIEYNRALGAEDSDASDNDEVSSEAGVVDPILYGAQH